MTDEELMRMKKIEKREKIDMILAYALIVILLACIAIILYLKFVKKEDKTVVAEQTPTYISIDEIVTSINSGTLNNKYSVDNASFNASTSNNAIVITYKSGDKDLNLNIPIINNELEVTLDNDNKELIDDIYKEITNIVCTYYGNSKDSCEKTVNSLTSDSSIQGIRFVNNNDTNYVYIDITKSIEVSNTTIYTEEVKLDLINTDYILRLEEVEISNVSINNSDTGLTISGNVKNLSSESKFNINIKVFDSSSNLLNETTEDFSLDSSINNEGTFEINIAYDDVVKSDNIDRYSITITR